MDLDQKKQLVSYLYQAWSGLAKFILHHCAAKSKCVDFPLVGRFFKRSVTHNESASELFVFVPHIDFISAGRFKFPQNDQNVSPLSKRVPKGYETVKVSLSSIASVGSLDRELVASMLKDVMQ